MQSSSASATEITTQSRAERGQYVDILARVACGFVIMLVIALDVAGIVPAYHLLQTPCSPCDPNSIQATTVQVQGMVASGLSLKFYALAILALIVITESTYIVLGVTLFVRRSTDRMALFTALTLVTFGGAAFTGTLHALASVNTALWLAVVTLNFIGQSAFIIFLYIFPDGRFVPRWTIAPAIIWTLSWVFALTPIPVLSDFTQFLRTGPAFLAILLSMVVAQVYRYRRVSTTAQRQQTKWVVYGLGVGLTGFAVSLILANMLLPPSVVNSAVGVMLGNILTYGCFLIIPVGIAAAVLRSRLYDIDILINRTLVYGSLTAILAGVYFGLVIGAQSLTQALTSQKIGQQPVVIVLSTLLIAALVQPLRARLQRGIDQRFYRSRYNAAKTVEAFSISLRNEVNLQELNERLLTVVEQTMRPTHVSLWVRATARRPSEGPRHGDDG